MGDSSKAICMLTPKTSIWPLSAVALLGSSTRHRQIVLAQDWDGLGFTQIASEQDLTPDAVRMRYQRALPRLADLIRRLERGEISELLEESEPSKDS